MLSGEGGYIAAPIALESFLARYEECAAQVPRATQVTQVVHVDRVPQIEQVDRVRQVARVEQVAAVPEVSRVTQLTESEAIAPPPVAAFEPVSSTEEALREEALREAFRPQPMTSEAAAGISPKWRGRSAGMSRRCAS